MKKMRNNLIYPFMIMELCLMLASSCNNPTSTEQKSGGTVTDIDGNVYHTVKIGTQVWLVENLKTTKYRNGDPIPTITDDDKWQNTKTGAYCNYNNDANNSAIYGRLYNWYAVNDYRNIAPIGWHVPTITEWITLITYLNGEDAAYTGPSTAIIKLKEIGTTHWQSPNAEATNETGFTALPGGKFYDRFIDFGTDGWWWSSTEDEPTRARHLTINKYEVDIMKPRLKYEGLSVRCLKD